MLAIAIWNCDVLKKLLTKSHYCMIAATQDFTTLLQEVCHSLEVLLVLSHFVIQLIGL